MLAPCRINDIFCVFFIISVGYVVGLGDRHVQNILIDCNTAELVHIDLGRYGTLPGFCDEWGGISWLCGWARG